MKKEEIYLDLSKCSQEEIKNVLAVLPEKKYWNQYDIDDCHYKLHFERDSCHFEGSLWWVINSVESKSKAEITYTQFMSLMKPQPTELEKEMFEFLEKVIRESMMSVLADEEAEVILEKYKNKYGG